ncbi:MAG: chloride channel protein [Proteobacteria bacterium]|nr:chloride channel protein [Pseudomonadota bacterium]
MSAKDTLPTVHRDTSGDFTTDRRLLLLSAMALVVGALGAGAAWALLRLIALFTNLAYFQRLSIDMPQFAGIHLAPWTIAIPVLGSLVVGLMARFGSDKIRGHGIPEAIEAILIGESRIEPKVAALKPLSSAIAIGTGGPFGAEGPIIMTGGALGSLFAQLFHLSAPERKTLLVAGAAAGMTGVFGTPIAAVLLAVELLLFEWKPRSFIPVVVAAVVAATLRPLILTSGPLFAYAAVPNIPVWGLLLCALAGIVAGLQSALLTVCLYGVEDLFRKLPIHWMWWPALGGVVVGIGGYLDPAVLGVGYDNIRSLLAGSLGVYAAISLLADKALVWIVALSSGTSGGVLAPLLIMGGALGALEAHIMPFGDAGFWALLGMAAILGGTMRAPLTSTFFAVELTGNTHILLPLLVGSVAAFAVTVLVMRRSILTERIARRGHHIMREYTIDPFLQTRVERVMTRVVHTLPASMPVPEAIEFFTTVEGPRRHKSYPIIDDTGILVGMASRADVLRWIREHAAANATLGDVTGKETNFMGYADELVGDLADRMAAADIGRVPIVDRGTLKVVGLVARRDILRVRAYVVHEEKERRRLLRMGSGPQ